MNAHQLHITLSALDFWTLFSCVGLLISRLWLLPAGAFADPAVERRWHRLLGLGLAALTGAGIALFLVRTVEMAAAPLMDILPLLPQVLQQAHFGHVWGIHLVALAALWAGWGVSHRLSVRSGMGIMLAAVLVLAFTYSATSHAADQGDFQLPEINDWLHVLAASAWGGGIMGTALFIFPALRSLPVQERRSMMAAVAGRLSSLSVFALMAVFLTGLLNAALRLGYYWMLFTTAYGRILLVKLLLVALMALLGAVNRFILVPKIQQSAKAPKDCHALGRFRASLRIDTALVLLVLIAAAALIQGMPPAAMQGKPDMEHGNMPGMDNMPGMTQQSMPAMQATTPAHLQITHAWARATAPGQETGEVSMVIISPEDTTGLFHN